MNCDRFQENLLDYVDDALLPPEKAAAQAHLGECSACRELVQNEWLIGQVISGHLREAVETVTLDARAQRRMADAIRKQIENAPDPEGSSLFPSWIRLAIPSAAAALLVISAIWFGHGFRSRNLPKHIVSSPGPAGLEVPVHVSWSVPRYTFRQEGATVVDALTSDTRVGDATLFAKTQTNPNHYDH